MSFPPCSSIARSTPGTPVPPTQNTAPVFKFRCLFTHDLRRKAKRWQDGYLRFHTFNKRCMVYDDAGNFIGDHHWRDSSEIQDGDELELDKGALIQVGECMEKTQTDISALFEKRKVSQESPTQQKPTTIPPSSRASMNSQSTPLKSLNDLLGIKRPSIGRSIVPPSPYEQRHREASKNETAGHIERPPKRQKQGPTGELLQRRSINEPLRSQPVIIDLEKSPIREMRPPKRIPESKSLTKQTNIANNTSKISATNRIVGSCYSENDVSREPSASTTTEQRIPERQAERQTESTAGSATSIPSTNKRQLPGEVDVTTTAPINQLKIMTEKPRQKLLYRALLQPKSTDKAASSKETNSMKAYDRLVTTSRESPYPSTEFGVSDATLALFDELVDDTRTAQTDSSSSRSRPPKEVPLQIQKKTLYSVPLHQSPVSPAEANSTSETIQPSQLPSKSRLDSSLHTTAIATAPVSERTVLARSNSDVAAMSPEPRPIISFPKVPVAPNPAILTKRNEPKIFRKSISDPTALRNVDSHRHQFSHPIATKGPPNRQWDVEDSGERGPWTPEALDLFDWWPAGRPKPI